MRDEESAAFETQVARVRASGWLGRSQSLARLFDILAEARRQDRSLREVEVAQEVFGRREDLSGDASVRVYVHRLRKKLAEFYAGPGSEEPYRLTVPLGEYRLELDGAHVNRAAPAPSARLRKWRIAAAVALLIAVNLAGWLWFIQSLAPERELAALARRPPWTSISGERPVLLVIGDYYIFGESDGMEVHRMIREFTINSADELEQFLMERPELQGRYVDLNTDYTPTGATLALKDILPVVQSAAGGGRRVRIITSSALTPDMLKTADIVYLGYLSALRLLEQPVFAGARLQVGETYDDLIDRRTGRRFTSNAAEASRTQDNIDYGYLRAFSGPSGNSIIVIAGTRDIGVMQMAETVANGLLPSSSRRPIEALYEVRGVGRTNLSAREVDLDQPR